MVRTLLVGGVMVLCLAGLARAAGKPGKAKKTTHSYRGAVAKVERGADGDAGVIVVAVKKGKKAVAVAAPAVERKVLVTKATQVVLVRGKKGALEETPATFADVKAGDRVAVIDRPGKSHLASKVIVRKGKKKA